MVKNVLITGILGGIGQSIADIFSDKTKYNIIGIDYNDDMDIKNKIPYDYYNIDLSKHDITEDITNMINKYDEINVIIHSAAKQVCSSIENTNIELWEPIMNVNIKSFYRIVQLCLPKLNGNIIAISSVHSFVTSKDISIYATSKAALSGLIRNMALELASKNIRVNGIAPGAILTSMLTSGIIRRTNDIEKGLSILSEKHPMHKIGKPNDVAELAYFLSDDEKAGFITGQTIVIDGGVSIHLSTE